MATVYRAYGTRSDFEKYKIFRLQVTLLLALTGVLAHVSYSLLPWILTLYICWSPWHCSGQDLWTALAPREPVPCDGDPNGARRLSILSG